MKRISLGLFLSLLSLTAFATGALAQTSAVPPAPANKPGTGGSVSATPKRDQDRKFYENLRMSYSLDYDGPRLSNFDVLKTQGPTDEVPDYSIIFHTLKVGYSLSKKIAVGFQFGGMSNLNPTSNGFSFMDIQNYVNWSKMVETNDLEMQGVLKLNYPTTEGSRQKGRIISIRAQGNWTIKTPLRNWSFTASTKFTSNFFRNPTTASGPDFVVALEPYITVDLASNVQWVFEGSFDATHNYTDANWDFRQADADSFDTGPSFTINSHTSLTTTIKFYTQNISFENATTFVDLSLSL